MAEYYERSAIVEYIRSYRCCTDVAFHMEEHLNEIPAADVRPVVYCKDCVYFIRGELFGDMVCDYHYRKQYHAEPNEFCSHAQKREES